MQAMNKRIDTGDTVLHEPSQEIWVIAYADYKTDKLSWLGWPQDGEANISDCKLIEKATPEKRDRLFYDITEQLSGNSRAHSFAAERLRTKALLEQLATDSAHSSASFVDYLKQYYNVDINAIRLATIKPDDANQANAKAELAELIE